MKSRSIKKLSYLLFLALLAFIISTQSAVSLDSKNENVGAANDSTWNQLIDKIDTIINSFFEGGAKTSEKQKETIVIRDTKMAPIFGDINTYDETKQQRKLQKTSIISVSDIPVRGELEVNAISSKNVGVKLKVNEVNNGEIIFDDYGKNNPVPVRLPGRVVKYVEIGARNISFSSANITIRYSDSELNGGNEYDLTIYHWNGASWDALPTIVDMANKTLSATTTSLSPFGVATSYIYYFENNATNQSVGADGNTTFNASGTTITVLPYKNLLKNGTMGTTTQITFGALQNTLYELFRFYLPINYSVNTSISANATYTMTWSSTSQIKPDNVNVSLRVYNPATGAKTVMGIGNISTLSTSFTAYTGTIPNPQFTVPAGSRLMVRINTTTGGFGGATKNIGLQFNDNVSSFINVTETQIGGGVNLSNISALTQTTPAGTNFTYLLNLTNNGTASDTYNITVSNPNNAAIAATNITSVTLNAGASKVFTLNVTNTSSGTFRVNVTATARNSSQFGYINTTTTVTDITPPSVTSNTNNAYVANDTFVSLNASITDTDTGVKNATVNVSQINSTINAAVLTLTGGYWVNNSIIADKVTSGFVNLTITAYDNAGNVNSSVNMTVQVNTPIDTSFTVSLPIGETQAWFNASLKTQMNVTARNQTASAGFLNIINTGNVNENFYFNITSALPSGVTLKAGTDNNSAGATAITTTSTIIVSGLTPSSSHYIWLWTDFLNASPMDAQRILQFNSSQ